MDLGRLVPLTTPAPMADGEDMLGVGEIMASQGLRDYPVELPAMATSDMYLSHLEVEVLGGTLALLSSATPTSPGQRLAPATAPLPDKHDFRAPATAGFFMPEGGRHACAYPQSDYSSRR